MTNHIGGYKPTPDNYVYNKFGDVRNGITKLASSVNNEYHIPEHTSLSNQLSLSSCVANATCDALEILKGIEDPNSVVQLSRLFVYWNARLYDRDTDKDEGTHISNAFDSLKRYGVCPESEWQYDIGMVFAQPSIRAYKTANDNELSSFYRIDSLDEQRLSDIEAAVRANHPVVFGTSVGQEFENYSGGGPAFGLPANSLGGHALIVTGVRRNPDIEFCIRNSWGASWGDDGHCWFNASYMLARETNDLWVPTRMDNLLI